MAAGTPRETPQIDVRANVQCDANFLSFLSGAHMLSSVLFTAVELRVFDGLQGRRTLPELAAELNVPQPALERLVAVLLSLGLVLREEAGHLRNTELATRMLTRTGSMSLCSFMLHQQRHVMPLFRHLTDAVRTGEPQNSRWGFASSAVDDRDAYETIARLPDECRLFLEAMNAAAMGVGASISQEVDFGPIRRLVDFGGGGGQIAVELVEAVPHLEVTIVDYPEACRFARSFVASKGLADRVHAVPGDFLADALPAELGTFDAVLLGGVLADWDPPRRTALLSNAARCLASSGTLLVSETLLDEDGSGPLLPALLSLTMLVGMRGQNFTPSEMETMLTAAGFVDVRVVSNRHLGVRDLVVASRG